MNQTFSSFTADDFPGDLHVEMTDCFISQRVVFVEITLLNWILQFYMKHKLPIGFEGNAVVAWVMFIANFLVLRFACPLSDPSLKYLFPNQAQEF